MEGKDMQTSSTLKQAKIKHVNQEVVGVARSLSNPDNRGVSFMMWTFLNWNKVAQSWVFLSHRFAFSRNNQPTIVPIPNPDVPIGRATQMSPNDILRVNRLYRCSE